MSLRGGRKPTRQSLRLLRFARNDDEDYMIFLKIVFLIALGIYGLAGFFKPDLFAFINGVNLLFHEAGHVFFGFLGEYVGVWGGTLTQLLIPFGIGVGFLMRGDKFSASVMFLWFAQNFSPISIYIKDARAQALQYVGGDIHDWHYILVKGGILHHDHLVGNIVWSVGFVLILFIVVINLVFLAKLKEVPKK